MGVKLMTVKAEGREEAERIACNTYGEGRIFDMGMHSSVNTDSVDIPECVKVITMEDLHNITSNKKRITGGKNVEMLIADYGIDSTGSTLEYIGCYPKMTCLLLEMLAAKSDEYDESYEKKKAVTVSITLFDELEDEDILRIVRLTAEGHIQPIGYDKDAFSKRFVSAVKKKLEEYEKLSRKEKCIITWSEENYNAGEWDEDDVVPSIAVSDADRAAEQAVSGMKGLAEPVLHINFDKADGRDEALESKYHNLVMNFKLSMAAKEGVLTNRGENRIEDTIGISWVNDEDLDYYSTIAAPHFSEENGYGYEAGDSEELILGAVTEQAATEALEMLSEYWDKNVIELCPADIVKLKAEKDGNTYYIVLGVAVNREDMSDVYVRQIMTVCRDENGMHGVKIPGSHKYYLFDTWVPADAYAEQFKRFIGSESK